jgi:hypothetical protein
MKLEPVSARTRRFAFRLLSPVLLIAAMGVGATAAQAATPGGASTTTSVVIYRMVFGAAPTASHAAIPGSSSTPSTPNAVISGDCGRVAFVNNGSGRFGVRVDSYYGTMWWIDWRVTSLVASTGSTRYPYSTSDIWTGRVGVPPFGQGLLLTGDAFTANGWCFFVPNPA